LLLPAMKKAREWTVTTQCLSRMRQLGMGWHAYAMDHEGELLSAETTNYGVGAERALLGRVPERWIKSGHGNTLESIREGALYDYIRNVEAYRCPADETTKKWSHSINILLSGHDAQSWLGWYPDGVEDHVFNFDEIINPSRVLVFGEEDDPRGFNAGSWMIPSEGDRWVDFPAIRHPKGANFTFADGHAEYHAWLDPATLGITEFYQTTPDNVDLKWVQAHIHPKR